VEYLVENGADINIKNEDGKTALDIAIIEDRYTEVIEYLESLSNK
jgi:ankyrin repeat protein